MDTKKYLTTYEASKICQVGLSTVILWVNEGKLKAFRTPGGHRRILKGDLAEFLKKYKMPVPPALSEKHSGGNAFKILIVDDDELTVKILSQLLRGAGKILAAYDGFAAGAMVEKELPDVILLDIFLPGADGIEVCRRIKSSPQTKHIKVIGMTAYAKTGVKDKIMAAGAEECVTKPFDLNYIKERITAIASAASAQT